MKKLKKAEKWLMIFGFFFLLSGTKVSASEFYYPPDTDGKLVVVIDPGHGGENLGADYNGFLEKEMNMTVANAMAEELRKYEGITVYLTHESADDDMSIKKRADFAASVNADFVFCLHFNMSLENKLFGSEVWISAFGEENRQGYQFGYMQLEAMQDMGLFLRGIKTRLNDKGTDYYGILRFCEEYDIPAALIEHCHLDHENDTGYCDSEEDLVAFGVADATAAAKFFGLKSEELQVDYSDYANTSLLTPGTLYAKPDQTDPDICLIEEAYVDLENSKVGIKVTGCDYDSPMLFYSYSIDGGKTYSPYLAWPDTNVLTGEYSDTFTFEVEIPQGVSPSFLVRAFNQYDLFAESNFLTGYPVFGIEADEVLSPVDEPDVTISTGDVSEGNGGFKAPERESTEKTDTFGHFLILCLLVTSLLFLTFLIANLIIGRRKHQSRKRKKRR